MLLLGPACTQDVLVEPRVPDGEGQLLEPAPSATSHVLGRPERLAARVDLLGIELASLESELCPQASDTPVVVTRVTPSSLVQLIRRTGGTARTELARGSFAARSSEYEMLEGDLVRHYVVEHEPGRFRYSYDNRGKMSQTGSDAVPEAADPHDLHSAVLLLRSWRPRLGEAAHFFVVLGRRLWRVEVSARGPEMLTHQGVPQLGYRIDGEAVRLWEPSQIAPRRFSMWFSEDPARVPLRMVADASFGRVTLTLTERGSPEDCSEAARGVASTVVDGSEDAAIGRAWHGPAPIER